MMSYLIAVHCGAGYHSPDKESQYTSLCKAACQAAALVLDKEYTVSEAIEAAIKVLENSKITNAGRGSNLNIEGEVECDASMMDGESLLFGAVGAVKGLLNPIQAAHKLCKNQKLHPLSLGRIRPSVIVSNGALDWAKKENCNIADQNELITQNAKEIFAKSKQKVDSINGCQRSKNCESAGDIAIINKSGDLKRKLTSNLDKMNSNATISKQPKQSTKKYDSNTILNADDNLINGLSNLNEKNTVNCVELFKECPEFKLHCGALKNSILVKKINQTIDETVNDEIQDTVGAIVIDRHGNVASGVSSGGILLKHPGRIGPAATYGAGCWAENYEANKPSVGVVTSGCGEHIMRTLLAKKVADAVLKSTDIIPHLHDVFVNDFLQSKFLMNIEKKLAGCLVLMYDQSEMVDVAWGYTTDSMCVGYLKEGNDPVSKVYRLPEGQTAGETVCIEGRSFCHTS